MFFLLLPQNVSSFLSDVTILLSLTVFLNTVSESMPATSDAVPLISKRPKHEALVQLVGCWLREKEITKKERKKARGVVC
jgi:hypothetical protein